MVRVCAVIPAYNEADTIGEIVRETKRYVDKVFVIDDASKDGTAEVARENGAEIIQHVLNKGVGAAQRTGYKVAMSEGFDYVIQLDGDGQHNPKYIPSIIDALQDCDMVIGSRFLNGSHKKYHYVRRLGISFFSHTTNLLSSLDITDVTSGYRGYKTKYLRELYNISDRHWAVEQTLTAAKKNMKIKELSIEMPVRTNGASHLNFNNFALYPFRMVDSILRVMLFR